MVVNILIIFSLAFCIFGICMFFENIMPKPEIKLTDDDISIIVKKLSQHYGTKNTIYLVSKVKKSIESDSKTIVTPEIIKKIEKEIKKSNIYYLTK